MTWDFITDFGDTAVTVPLIALVLVFLAITRQWRPAIGWALAILGCGASIGAIKALLIGCGYRTSVAGVVSPSGHAAMSTAVYGSLVVIIAAGMPLRYRVPLFFAVALLILAIAVSRTILGAHTPTEVIVGAMIGVAAIVAFRFLAAPLPADLPVRWLGAASLLLIALLHGGRWPTERAVHGTAGYLHAWLPWCG
jgi:membrane-associated phospholipid phosphatase